MIYGGFAYTVIFSNIIVSAQDDVGYKSNIY